MSGKFACLLLLATLTLVSSSAKESKRCEACENFLNQLFAKLNSPLNIQAQNEYVADKYCDSEDEGCFASIGKLWVVLGKLVADISDINNLICAAIGAEENCDDFGQNNCVQNVNQFASIVDGETFGSLVDFLAEGDDGFCDLTCNPDQLDDACVAFCTELVRDHLAPILKSITQVVADNAQPICQNL